MINRILFICYANTCRTPAAEKLAEYYAQKYDLKGVTFDSAGFHIAFDHAQLETIDYIKSKGIEMEDFKPKPITRTLLEEQDLIIGMERYQLTKIRSRFKEIKEKLEGKLYTLKEFNGAGKKYFEILEIVEKNVEQLIQKVKEINQVN